MIEKLKSLWEYQKRSVHCLRRNGINAYGWPASFRVFRGCYRQGNPSQRERLLRCVWHPLCGGSQVRSNSVSHSLISPIVQSGRNLLTEARSASDQTISNVKNDAFCSRTDHHGCRFKAIGVQTRSTLPEGGSSDGPERAYCPRTACITSGFAGCRLAPLRTLSSFVTWLRGGRGLSMANPCV